MRWMNPPAASPVASTPVTRLTASGAPVGADVGEDLGGVGQQVAEEHGHAVEGVVLRGDDVGLPEAVPVEGRVEHRLEEVAVREVVGPLALSLEPCRDGVVAERLLAEPLLRELGIARP